MKKLSFINVNYLNNNIAMTNEIVSGGFDKV